MESHTCRNPEEAAGDLSGPGSGSRGSHQVSTCFRKYQLQGAVSCCLSPGLCIPSVCKNCLAMRVCLFDLVIGPDSSQSATPRVWQVHGQLRVWCSATRKAEPGLPLRNISREGASQAQGETADEQEEHLGWHGLKRVTGIPVCRFGHKLGKLLHGCGWGFSDHKKLIISLLGHIPIPSVPHSTSLFLFMWTPPKEGSGPCFHDLVLRFGSDGRCLERNICK